MDEQRAGEALERWLAALNACGEPALVERAVAPGAVVERYSWGGPAATQVERLEGAAAIAGWLARAKVRDLFALEGPIEPGGEEISAAYRVTFGDFQGGGEWKLRLSADGRIAWLSHRPRDLPDEWKEGLPPGKRLPGMS